MTSCGIYSAKYEATYTLQNTENNENTRKSSIDFINYLAGKNSLTKDSRFNNTDTLAFYGRPYHHFKFWFEQKDNNQVFRFDYWGMYGNRKKPLYRDLFKELDDFLNINFIILEQSIKDENDSKNNNDRKNTTPQ